ncbi:hypothetical protein SCALM49S_09133 [Streptomyces californicus]
MVFGVTGGSLTRPSLFGDSFFGALQSYQPRGFVGSGRLRSR